MSGVTRHVLYNTWFPAANFGNAVVVIARAGVDDDRFVDSRSQICLCGLLGQVGSRDVHLQTGFAG